jgi:hypothetical protein
MRTVMAFSRSSRDSPEATSTSESRLMAIGPVASQRRTTALCGSRT